MYQSITTLRAEISRKCYNVDLEQLSKFSQRRVGTVNCVLIFALGSITAHNQSLEKGRFKLNWPGHSSLGGIEDEGLSSPAILESRLSNIQYIVQYSSSS